MPRRLRFRGGHAEVLSQQGVGDCGFSNVRRAHDADEAGAEAGLRRQRSPWPRAPPGARRRRRRSAAAAASAASAVAAGAPSASSILSISTAFVPLTGRPRARHWSLRSGTRSSARSSLAARPRRGRRSPRATVHSAARAHRRTPARRRVPGFAAAQHEEQGEACCHIVWALK